MNASAADTTQAMTLAQRGMATPSIVTAHPKATRVNCTSEMSDRTTTVTVVNGFMKASKGAYDAQLNTTFPECPEPIVLKPSRYSATSKRCVIIGVRSSPPWISAIILYQVSYISRP